MRFGEIPVEEAEGAVLAHGIAVGQRNRFKKGRRLTPQDVADLRASGIARVTVARLDSDDIGENEAAARVAEALSGDDSLAAGSAATGRANLFARTRGLVVYERARLERLNLVDEAVTVAALPPYERVEAQQMVATVKIIPLAVPEAVVARCTALASENGGMIRVAPFRPLAVGLIQTSLPGTKNSVIEKGRATTEARIDDLGCRLVHELRCRHDADEIAEALVRLGREGCDIVLVLGAAATVDRRDVVPQAIEKTGGTIDHFGLPVDPGNLTLLARRGTARILGLPGSARSPRLHGFDWVLQRLVAGLPISKNDIAAMASGGLLKEIPGRPFPRAAASASPAAKSSTAHHPPRIAAVVLAAGQSRRMGETNKLLVEIDGKAMVAWVVDAVLASTADPVIVVLGHEADRVRNALSGRDLVFVFNPAHEEGLSTSLRRGIAAVPDHADGALICLGDMPRLSTATAERLIAAFDPDDDRHICVPTFAGKRGNPVLIGRRFFAEIHELTGDVGARQIVAAYPDLTATVAMDDDAVLDDVDTPDALARLHPSRGRNPS